jgi:phage shock protein PspC (stress-responsive transcriptional regulator)
MKKTISINIGGNIFHIEEEGYEKLKAYLDSVHKYFSTFEDSKEITDDIENRIAEKFYSQLKRNKEAISTKEVDQLIASMGTVADFEATFDDEPKDQKQEQTSSKEKDNSEGAPADRKLYRDAKNKILGGVASGFANYFKIDPLWIRLLWIVFLFSGVGLLAYIIFWIVLPSSNTLEELKASKKFYRNPDGRVLGGVSGGIASYFGIDTVVVRLLFIISIFIGGSGIILYIILWIITPEAKSVTEKMEMKGEPVTMSGIEKNVKKSLKIEENDENVFVKILLFPFRLIAMIFDGLGRMLGPVMTFVIEAVRVVFGAFVFLTGFGIMIAMIFSLFFFLGMEWSWSGQVATIDGIAISDFLTPLGPLASISAFFVVFIPALGISLLGLTILLKKRIGNAYVALSMVVIWVLAIIGATFTIPSIVGQFGAEDAIEEEVRFAVSEEIPTLRLNDKGWDKNNRNAVDLRLRGHDADEYLLIIDKEARGSSRENARQNAAGANYEVTQDGPDFYFDSKISLKKNTKFRFQNVDATLYIPYGKEFKMDQELGDILVNTLHLNGYYGYQMEDNTWVFDEDGIRCLTCTSSLERNSRKTKDGRSFEFENFTEVNVSSSFKVKVYKSDEYDVRLDGKRGDLDNVIMKQVDEELSIRYEEDENWRDRSKDITISIYLPELAYFKASGEASGTIEDFTNDELEIVLSGDTEFRADVNVKNLKIDLSGSSDMSLRGDAEMMEVEMSGVSKLNSMDLDAKNVTFDGRGESNAKIYADDKLKVNASGDCRVYYRGTSDAEIVSEGSATVRRD